MAFNWMFWKKKETPPAGAPPAPPQLSGKAQPEETSWMEVFRKFKGNLPQILAAAKNPSVLKKARELQERMEKDGVNTSDVKAVQAWIEQHKAELIGQPGPKPQTYVRESPRLGRNDPCHCGSGKKFKRCHGAAAA